jgi:Xaa-Pro aminopeptidase
LQKLRRAIGEKGLDALLVSHQPNYRYLSGFTGSSGFLLIAPTHALLATDFRYVEQAKQEAPTYESTHVKGELCSWLPQLACDLGWRKLGFEADHISVATYHKLGNAIETKRLNLELLPTASLVEQLRSIKEPEELLLIGKAAELADAAFQYAKSTVHPAMTEMEAAWGIESFLRQGGSEGIPFEIILASGPNSALPHAKPGTKVIQSGEPVLVDMGARIGGYCSDFSRTICVGQPDTKLLEIYDVVLEAQLAAIEGVESGMNASQADALARTVIEKSGYGDAFGHSLGHGVGLEVHESPTLSSSSSDLLSNGMVFTIEPGIYIAGCGGVRIENTVILEKGKVKVITRSEKRLAEH